MQKTQKAKPFQAIISARSSQVLRNFISCNRHISKNKTQAHSHSPLFKKKSCHIK
jgi:hypothetical protein